MWMMVLMIMSMVVVLLGHDTPDTMVIQRICKTFSVQIGLSTKVELAKLM